MASIFDVDATKLIEKVAEELQKNDAMQPPTWAAFVKTGAHKERPPAREDWWHVRAASVLRTIAQKGPIGVAKLRTKYGGKRNRGNAPERVYKGSGNIMRKVLQQLEKAGFAIQKDINGHKGRVITPQGVSLLDKAATVVRGPRKAPKQEAPKKEEPAKKEAPKKEESPKEQAPEK